MEAFWTEQKKLVGRIDAEFYTPEFVNAEERLLSNVETRPFSKIWKEYNRIYIGIAGFDSVDSPKDYTPYIRPTDIGDNGEIDYEHLPWCRREWLDDYAPKGCAKPGDLLVEVKGNTRRAAVVSERIPPNCLVSGSAYRVQLNEGTDPYFVQAFLLSSLGQTLKRRLTSNTTISYIDPESFQAYRIPYPKDEIQKAIGNKVRKAERLRELAEREQRYSYAEIDTAYNGIKLTNSSPFGWVGSKTFDSERVDAWYHQPAYIALSDDLRKRSDFIEISQIARVAADAVQFNKFKSNSFDYYEIADIESDSGAITSKQVPVGEAPSRAKYLVKAGDILVSTVRPNRKGIAVVPDDVVEAVCSSGFAVLRTDSIPTSYYLRACLLNDISTHQLMRWNTGATYPAIERTVPLRVRIPDFGSDKVEEIGSALHKAAKNITQASSLISDAKSNVEELIDDTLDEEKLLREDEEIERWLKENSAS